MRQRFRWTTRWERFTRALAEPRFWHLERFETTKAFDISTDVSKRQLVRMMNLELFDNAYFSKRRKGLDEFMTAEGLNVFQGANGGSGF